MSSDKSKSNYKSKSSSSKSSKSSENRFGDLNERLAALETAGGYININTNNPPDGKAANDKLSTLLSLDIFPSSELDIESAAAAAAAANPGGNGDGGDSVAVSNEEEEEGVPIAKDGPSLTVVRDTDAMARLALLGGGF